MCKSKEKYVLHKITVSSSAIITKGLEKYSLEACGILANVKMWEHVWLSVLFIFFCGPQGLLFPLSIVHAHSLLKFLYSSTWIFTFESLHLLGLLFSPVSMNEGGNIPLTLSKDCYHLQKKFKLMTYSEIGDRGKASWLPARKSLGGMGG